jgi:glycosyltransferase involved in cell wall biosynthesis
LKKYKLACLVSHPIQYQVPLFREISQDPRFDLEVLFCSDKSTKSYLDEGFNRAIIWDVPLIGGYKHIFLPSIFDATKPNFFNPLNYHIHSILKKGNYDAVWIHGWGSLTAISTILFAKILKIKVLMRGESGIHMKKPTGIKGFLRIMMISFLNMTVDGFLAIGTNNKDYYLDNGVPSSKIFLVPYAVDNNFFLSHSCKRLEIDKITVKESETVVILFASKLERRKRADLLIDAFASLLKKRLFSVEPILIIVGDGPEKSTLIDRARMLPHKSIHFLGFKNQSELPAYYDMADIFVLPSEQEPWGLVVNEVMNLGCAVIASDEVGCVRDLVVHEETGMIFTAGNMQALEKCLEELCSNSEKRLNIAKQAKDKIKNWSYSEDINGLYQALGTLCV